MFGLITNLVYVVVNMFASNDWCNGVSMLGLALSTRVSKLGSFLLETSLDGGSISVASFAVLNGHHLVLVLFRENLTVLDGLDGGVVVILVDLTVNGGLSLFMLVFMNAFLLDRRIDLLVDGGVMFSGLVPGVMTSISCCSKRAYGRLDV